MSISREGFLHEAEFTSYVNTTIRQSKGYWIWRKKIPGTSTALSMVESCSEASGYFSDINNAAKCSHSCSQYNQIQINTKRLLLLPRQRHYKQVRRESFLPSYWVYLQGKLFSPFIFPDLVSNLALSSPAVQPAEPKGGLALRQQQDSITNSKYFYQIKACSLNGLKHFSCAASIQEINQNNTNKSRFSFWTVIQIHAGNPNNSHCFIPWRSNCIYYTKLR